MQINLKTFVWGVTIAIALALVVILGKIFYQTRPNKIVASLLRLNQIPLSMRDVECESWGMTDVLTTCAFTIDAAEFPRLLKGWPFAAQHFYPQYQGSGSHSFSVGSKFGTEFPVATVFALTPIEFKHGGRISLVTNASRTRVQVDYYEE